MSTLSAGIVSASKVDTNNRVLEELRAFRSEVMNRLNNQESEIKMLIPLVSSTKVNLVEFSRN